MGPRNREAGLSGIYGANISQFKNKKKKERKEKKTRVTSKSLSSDAHLHTQSKAQWQRLQRIHSNLLQGNNFDKVALQRRCLIGFRIYFSAPVIKC